MELAQLRALVAVVDTGGFTAAARMLGMTQPGVSRAVAALEGELGVTLVVRGRNGVRLTAHGERALAQAREVLVHLVSMTEDAIAVRERGLTRLRLAAVPSAAGLVAQLVDQMAERLPETAVVALEGSDREVAAWLATGTADAGVLATLDADPPAGGVLLAEDRIVAVLHPSHPLADETGVAIEDLADDPLLLSDNGCEPLLLRLYAAARCPMHPAHRVRRMTTLLTMVREDLGITLVPELALPEGHQRLACVPLVPGAWRRLHLVPADSADIPAAVRALLDVADRARTLGPDLAGGRR